MNTADKNLRIHILAKRIEDIAIKRNVLAEIISTDGRGRTTVMQDGIVRRTDGDPNPRVVAQAEKMDLDLQVQGLMAEIELKHLKEEK